MNLIQETPEESDFSIKLRPNETTECAFCDNELAGDFTMFYREDALCDGCAQPFVPAMVALREFEIWAHTLSFRLTDRDEKTNE